jgi:hypothetical protein
MRGFVDSSRTATCGALIAIGLLTHTPAAAQGVPENVEPPATTIATRTSDTAPRPLLADTFLRVFTDPTTYALPAYVYTMHRLDWDTSQQVFAYGYVEANPDFTVSGRVADTPISYEAGKRKILRYSLSTMGNTIINNAACAIVERRLIERAPEHRKLIRTLGWIERGVITAYWSNHLAHNQAMQWRDNERVLGQLRAANGAPGSAAIP